MVAKMLNFVFLECLVIAIVVIFLEGVSAAA
jgi:hypothetical protein